VYKLIHDGESDGTSGRDTDRYLGIIIANRSSQDRVRAGEALVGREESTSTRCDLFQRYWILIARVRSSREDISCFLFINKRYQAKVRMFYVLV